MKYYNSTVTTTWMIGTDAPLTESSYAFTRDFCDGVTGVMTSQQRITSSFVLNISLNIVYKIDMKKIVF